MVDPEVKYFPSIMEVLAWHYGFALLPLVLPGFFTKRLKSYFQ
jgi:hypothetical protein